MRAVSRPFSRARAEIRAHLGRVLAVAAAGLLAVFLVAALPGALQEAWKEVGNAADDHESLTEARSRLFGESYTRAIEEIRRALPADESYLIVEGGSGALGGTYWVRYDLAPRRAVYLAPMYVLTGANEVRRRLPLNLRHVVVAYGPQKPPRLYDRYLFVQEIDRLARARSAARRGPGSGR